MFVVPLGLPVRKAGTIYISYLKARHPNFTTSFATNILSLKGQESQHGFELLQKPDIIFRE
jgi:hypothetical protein